jgi:adenosylcobinamide-GDP ribazoletransferase
MAMRGLILAIQFLTRLPTPQLRDLDAANLPRSAHWFPLVGLLIGVLLVATLWLGSRIDPWLGALLTLLLWVWITGALHLDGLADMSDALGASHRDRERFLAVLAAQARSCGQLVLAGIQANVLMLLARSGQYWAVLLVPAWARWGVLVWARLPSLKPGMGERLRGQIQSRAIWLWGAVLIGLSLCFPVLCGVPLLVLLWRQFLLRRLGGMTGDLLGAGVELVESAALLLLLIAPVHSVSGCPFC